MFLGRIRCTHLHRERHTQTHGSGEKGEERKRREERKVP